MKNLLKIVPLVLSLIVSSCTTTQEGDAASLSPADFSKKIQSTADVIVLDVRTMEETEGGMIEGAKRIDYRSSDFKNSIEQLDKSKVYLVYCAGGGRSSKTQEMMKANGFSQVINLDGGFNAWKAEGLPVVMPSSNTE